jgi:hypothetical protein
VSAAVAWPLLRIACTRMPNAWFALAVLDDLAAN